MIDVPETSSPAKEIAGGSGQSGPKFIHLTAKSSFSLLEGMVPVKKLAKAAAKMKMPALGVTELGNLFSAVEVSKYLSGEGVQPILGCELPVWLPRDAFSSKPRVAGFLPLLVQDEQGWRNLARLVSLANESKRAPDGQCGLALDEVLQAHQGLIALTGSYTRGLVAGWKQVESGGVSELVGRLQEAFGDRLYGQLERHGSEHEAGMEQLVTGLAGFYDLPLVATNDSRFIKAGDEEAFEVLVGIGDGNTMDNPNRRRFNFSYALRSEAEMCEAFKDRPDALANSVEIAKRCAYLLEAVPVKKMFMPKWEFSGETPVGEVIRAEAHAGILQRLEDHVYPRCDGEEAKAAAKETYIKQLDYELDVINRMGFDGYFLITSDFIKWAKSHGIPVGPGRGSGAGSAVAWALQITDLDPIRWELYFERFLNPDRVSLPDFDIDFCQDRREEVIAYVRERFGHERVSQIITFGTLKARACLRDVGRVLGLGYNFVGQIAAFIPEVAVPPSIREVLEADERLSERYEAEEDVKRLLDTAMELEGCYRHASTHAAGVIITDRRIDEVCGLYVDPRSPIPATQFGMKDAEYAGLVKFDFLGLKTLSVVRMAEQLVRQEKMPGLEIMQIPLDDPDTYAMLTKGLTCGVFQIEGGGITDVTKKMQAVDMEGLSAILALYRPGPMDLIPKYLAVRHGREEAEYAHPLLEETLKVTFGIAVYQEQVMQMARVMAGYSLGGADVLRRAMGKKNPAEMAKERSKFVSGAAEHHGVGEEKANEVFNLMEVFAGYGFNKAHSMAYALISYQTAWLKTHYPLEFMAATMTYDRGNTDKLLRYKQELEKLKFCLFPADVNRSGFLFTVGERDGKGGVWHALSALKGASEEAMRLLVAEREAHGDYKDLWDLLRRLPPGVVNKKQLEVLGKSGALDSVLVDANGKPDRDGRARLLANLEIYQAYNVACAEEKASGQNSLFGLGDASESAGLDPAPFKASLKVPEEIDHLTRLGMEQEAVGFYLRTHPLEAFEKELEKIAGLKPLSMIEAFAGEGGGVCKVAGIVLSLREVKTKKGDRMGVVSLSDPSGQAEAAIFPDTYAQYSAGAAARVLQPGTPLVATLRVQQDGDRLRINADSLRPLAQVVAERAEILLEVTDAGAVPQIISRVQRVLQDGKGGQTRVKLRVPDGQGRQVMLKLPDGYKLDTKVLSNLRGVMGVVVH